jgi:Fe-S-cluster containining protein
MTESRTEFGFERTICDCRECTVNCEFISGYLIPADLERMKAALNGVSLENWALTALLASPGATVVMGGQLIQIPTLVPARRSNGHCIFLQHGRCNIHAISPFGCSFSDSHMSFAEAQTRSAAGLQAIIEAFAQQAEYARLWDKLYRKGLRAEAASVVRARMAAHMELEQELEHK